MAFLSVRAAAERVGKSTSSIRRLIHPIVKRDDHPDRDLVQPSVAEATRLRLAGVNFPWQVSEELLSRIPAAPATEHSPAPSAGKSGGSGEADLLAMLRGELDIKNRQIARQADLIGKQVELVGGLSERLREGNVLIASLQQRLAPTDGREERADPVAAVTASAPKTTDEPVEPAPPKRGFFARLFQPVS
jgi:hypothetical protein